jgi:hypothetical protein
VNIAEGREQSRLSTVFIRTPPSCNGANQWSLQNMTLLADALRAETLDESLAPIMRVLGIKAGDTAANIFSGLGDDEWFDLSLEDRRAWLVRWFEFEMIDAQNEVMESP